MSRAARPMPGASPSRASRWPARPAPRRCASSPRQEHVQRRDQERQPALEAARPWPVHRLRAGRRSRAMPAPASSSMARTAIRRCRSRATSCSSPRSAIRWALPHRLSGQRRGRRNRRGAPLMTLRPYAAAKRTLSHRRQAAGGELGPGAADHHHRLRRLRDALFGGGRAASAPGPRRRWSTSSSGWFILVAAAVIDIRVWMSLAYPAYGCRCCCWSRSMWSAMSASARSAGSRSARWRLQPSELMKISLVLALARFLHGKSVEDVSKPLQSGASRW